ncbi:MAG: methylmalonyl-CoA mutase [Actinobacteria bacterium]|nr:MAG: methylmalonyl-CoA mutase [Actinomycetota bacterium]REK37047.1 MAG: methylmalonyl-CoA mutase [Actinomycetota bacterium]
MDKTRITTSDIEIDEVYSNLPDGYALEAPGEFPFTRGPYPSMYRGRLWTMRQYAGFGTAEDTNRRFRSLLEAGQTGLSVAFDLPTQMGLDSDHELAAGEVGKVGVAIDTLADMQRLFDGIPLDEVSTSMTINATAPILLLLYELVAEEQGVPADQLRGTVQNDILKEYVARGTYIYPPRPSMRLITDLFGYANREIPNWNTISISGYHIREAGATAAQELAFTIANGLAYVHAGMEAGMGIDEFGPRLSFFWNGHNNLFEEVAKFRAARRIWAKQMRSLGATDPKAEAMRFHVQTAGSTLTAQQPLNNVARTTIQALAAILGGTQSLHTNAFDEALGLPTDESALVALRTQQILAHESGVADTVDPLAGSFFVENLTEELEAQATSLIARIEEMGGAVRAIEDGWMQAQIEESAYAEARRQSDGSSVVVGMNRFTVDEERPIPVLEVDPALEEAQVKRTVEWRSSRDNDAVQGALSQLGTKAATDANLLPPMKDALRAGATVGEISDALREVFGIYRPS